LLNGFHSSKHLTDGFAGGVLLVFANVHHLERANFCRIVDCLGGIQNLVLDNVLCDELILHLQVIFEVSELGILSHFPQFELMVLSDQFSLLAVVYEFSLLHFEFKTSLKALLVILSVKLVLRLVKHFLSGVIFGLLLRVGEILVILNLESLLINISSELLNLKCLVSLESLRLGSRFRLEFGHFLTFL